MATGPLSSHLLEPGADLPSEARFDDFVAELVRRNAGRHAPAATAVYERWRALPPTGTFLDHLVERGVLDRVGARAVLLSWEGRLDGRDTRQLANPEAIGRALGRLATGAAVRPVKRRDVARAIGSRLGDYVIKGVLGWGGCGPVYLGVHPTLRVPVAIKVVSKAAGPNGEALREGLRAEARRQASISHPNVVRIWDFVDTTEPFLVLEYVHGEDLRSRLESGPLSLAEAFTLFMHGTLALRAAHKVGVAHGDVKPGNLLMTPEGGYKLADFGLARSRRTFSRVASTATPRTRPSAKGSLNYMAPEQFEGEYDHRSDLYSLGLTVYQAISGVMPVPGDDFDAVMLRHKRGEVEPLHHVCPGVRREVSDLINQLIAVDPERRFNDHDVLLRAAETAFGLRLEAY